MWCFSVGCWIESWNWEQERWSVWQYGFTLASLIELKTVLSLYFRSCTFYSSQVAIFLSSLYLSRKPQELHCLLFIGTNNITIESFQSMKAVVHTVRTVQSGHQEVESLYTDQFIYFRAGSVLPLSVTPSADSFHCWSVFCQVLTWTQACLVFILLDCSLVRCWR